MGRRKKKKRRRHVQLMLKRDPILAQVKDRGDHTDQDIQTQAIPKQGAPLNTQTILQLQRSLGNRQASQIVQQQAMATVQREGTLKGYKRDKPPQPWGDFARPQAPHRRGGGRRRRAPAPPVPAQPAQQPGGQTVGPQIPSPRIKSHIISADAFKQQTTLKILGKFKYFIKKKWRRTGQSDTMFADWTERLRRYHGQMQGTALQDKVFFLRVFASDLGDWLTGRGRGAKKDSSRRQPVEALLGQLVTEVDALYHEVARQGWLAYQSLPGSPKEKAAFLQEILYQVRARSIYDEEPCPYFYENWDKSKMKGEAAALENTIDDELDRQLLEDSPDKEWFTKQQERTFKDDAAGGELNKLDLITYKFKLEMMGGELGKVPVAKGDPSALKGYFKKKSYEDLDWNKHRGRHHEMPRRTPGHHRRTVAMGKLDQLLGTNVLPPIFLARHHGKVGSFLEKVQGVSSQTPGAKNAQIVKETTGKLYLLDVIAGQVDRHHGNYLIEMKGKQVKGVKGIDLDLAFASGYSGQKLLDWERQFKEKDDRGRFSDQQREKHQKEIAEKIRKKVAGKLPFELEGINQETARRVVELSTGGQQLIRDALQGLVNEREIEATLDRLQVLAQMLRPIIEVPDGGVLVEV